MKTDLLIIGAGPFGLAMAAYAKHLGIDYILVGREMEFWKKNMPQGMYLRSASDWHLDPVNSATIENFLSTKNLVPTDTEPISRDLYLSYTDWFQHQKKIDAVPVYINRLDKADDHHFEAFTSEDNIISAGNVVVAVGFKYFKYVPIEVENILPPGSYSHTCDFIDMTAMHGKRCLIIGGRQSAFEWAALLNEAGTSAIHISHRHQSPSFIAADWSWVNPIVDNMADDPGWFRNLSEEEKDSVSYKLWAEGRMKIEPWLETRVKKENVKLWPHTQVTGCKKLPTGELEVSFNSGTKIIVDHIVLATGYKVGLNQIPFLANSNILSKIATRNGFPVLDEYFQTSLPGLFITSMPAGQDFGPFFGFTISVRTSAKLIGRQLMKNLKIA